ncbi:MAG: hypothetical protein IK052_03705 [Bacteroidales bacterium]|nr:hypothetical protein [Bacteroidales bacterium]
MKRSIVLLSIIAAGLFSASCVKVDNSLGKGLVDKNLIYNTYTEEFTLDQIKMKLSADLSGYSDSYLTIGAIRDDVFGLTTRSASFPLVPALDTIDLGKDPKAVSFDIYFAQDSISCASDSQKAIFQNIYVYELLDSLDRNNTRASHDTPHGTATVTKGIPVYDGSGALDFNFTLEYAQKYVDAIKDLGPILKQREGDNPKDVYKEFLKRMPGICIETDVPEGNGGRINMFKFSCLSVSSQYYYRNDNVALLKVNSEWNGVRKDSTFMFIPGEPSFVDEASALRNNEKFYQYCFNRTTHSTSECAPGASLYVEGGTGLKPVISAKELRDKTIDAITKNGGDPEKVIIVKATIELPYEQPADYMDMKYFPSILSPTIRVEAESDGVEYVTYAGLTDASVSTEDQGDIDRSNLMYSPDITYHLQELLKREDLDTETNADIWLLTIHTKKEADASGSLYDNSYYQNLLYASYYNSLYGGGYGGYGYGYGSGGYGYNSYYSNYYNYMMLAQMMAASQQQTYTYTQELDKDRYYKAVLNGPEAERKPVFRVTYAFPGK